MALNKTTTNAIADQAISSIKIEDGAITATKISDATTISITKTTITAVPPTITSLNVSQIDPSAGATVTITGTGFIAIPDVKFMNTTTGVRITPSAIGFTGSTQLTAAFPSGQTVGIYKVIVENPNGLSVLSTATITYSIAPAWATAEGSLGSFEEGDAINLSLLAYDDDSTAVTSYTLQSGSLPSGITLDGDSTIGSITGTAPNVDADTAFNFTIRAADDESQTSDRTFSMTITNWEVDNSLRFNSGSSDHLTRIPATTTNEKTFTFSSWVKFSPAGTGQLKNTLYHANIWSAEPWFVIQRSDTVGDDFYLNIAGYSGGYQIQLITNAVYRDPSAWYHIVVAIDTTQATSTNRVKLYVNGLQVTSFSTATYPSLNYDTGVNRNVEQQVGEEAGLDRYMSGYMSEVYLIDGQQLDPTSFGETDATSGIWIPKKNADLSFGTNGFHLKFDNSEALGADSSGNGNNFTVNNLTAIDQTTDTPQNNFATMNPLHSGSLTFSDGNLTQSESSSTPKNGISTMGASSGKWYAEVKCTAVGSNGTLVGFINLDLSNLQNQTIAPGQDNFSAGLYSNGGPIFYQSETTFATVGSISNGDIVQLAMDLDNGYLYWGKNGTWLNSSDPESGATGTGGLATSYLGVGFIGFAMWQRNGANASWNFGNAPYTIASGNSDANGYGNFEYSVPSGYYSLCTKNLSTEG